VLKAQRAPLEELPLFARAGTILPLLAPDVDTLTSYGRASGGLVHMRDRSRRLRLLAFPRGRSRAADGSARSSEARGSWKLVVRGSRGRGRRRVSLEASLATLANPFRPCTVRLNGHALRRGRAWTYDHSTRVLKVSFAARATATVVARRGCTAPR
jgi:hypothetical protein